MVNQNHYSFPRRFSLLSVVSLLLIAPTILVQSRRAIEIRAETTHRILSDGHQDRDPYQDPNSEEVALADFPLEFQVLNQQRMINGSYQYVGWTPLIRGRMLGQTHRGDEVMVVLSKQGQLIHILCVELRGTASRDWFEDFEIRGDDNDALSEFGTITATFKYYNNRDERTTTLAVRQFQVVKLADY